MPVFKHLTLEKRKKQDGHMESICRSYSSVNLPYSSLGLVHPAFHKQPASTRLALREATPIINLALSELAKVFHAPAHLLVGLSIAIL